MFRDDQWWMVILVKSLSLAFELLKILLCIAFIVLPVCIFFLLINAPALAIERELEECGKNVSRVWSITNLTLNLVPCPFPAYVRMGNAKSGNSVAIMMLLATPLRCHVSDIAAARRTYHMPGSAKKKTRSASRHCAGFRWDSCMAG
eukprot:303403-Rhodomonas_salina.2